MPNERKPTKAEVERFITDELRKAAKTQLVDSTGRLHPVRNQVGGGLCLAIGDHFVLEGILVPKDKANAKLMAALQKLGKPPKPPKKKSVTAKKK